MKNKTLTSAISVISWISLAITFYIFSRFTVDDAFISWRYGKNLIEYGVFNYNPSTFDMTQAYTNPIYALLSIIPNLLNINVVLFFKIISVVLTISFIFYLKNKHTISNLAILFIAIPSTIIHIFSGLETFLFVVLLVMLYDSLNEQNENRSILITILLFLTRPESFLLSILVPIYYLTDIKSKTNPLNKIKSIFINNPEKRFKPLILPVILFGILYIHKVYFGSYLPNTFFIKSNNDSFSLYVFVYMITFSLPVIFSTLFILDSKNTSLFYVFFFLFLGMSLNYAKSDLMMNYSQRFLFHIYAPAFFILLIKSTVTESKLIISYNDFTYKTSVTKLLAILLLVIYGLLQFNLKEFLNIADYYPRTYLSHYKLGEAIKNSNAKSLSFGDAGMTAYNAEINALDNIGLGSTLVSQYGVTKDTIDKYNPDLVLLHSSPESGVRLNVHNQEKLVAWTKENQLTFVCESIFRKDYSIRIYAKDNIVTDDILSVCENSKKNLMSSRASIFEYVIPAPFNYWK